MQQRRTKALLAIPIAGGLIFAACGGEADKAAAPTAATTSTDTSDAATNSTITAHTGSPGSTVTPGGLKDICPENIKIQTDWLPEAEHGFLYQMIGDGYTIDDDNASVTGPLMAGNVDTGVKFTVLSGGSASGFQNDTTLMYADTSILLGFVNTDEAIQNSAKFPTVAIESGFEKNPQMIMWDPATYPNVKNIADLGKAKVNIRYFGGAAYMDYFTSTGVLSKDQVEGSYKGEPSLFLADEGKAAQQGFGSAEPYIYEHEITGWMKPLKYQYINNVGWRNYAQSIATLPGNITKYHECFSKLVPIIQQASVDYINHPTKANQIIFDAIAGFGSNFGWVYTPGVAAYSVATIKADGLVANGPDGVMGKFDMSRVNELIAKAIPVYTAQDSPPKTGVTANDIVTNEFIDPSIGL